MGEEINIKFDKLRYSVKMNFYDVFGKNRKTILKGIHGEFRGCELTAIVGPSGSGKTTLLNILSGFITSDIAGSIKVNGKPRNLESLRKQSTFIMQEQSLHSLLTVAETMNFSMKLKTNRAMKQLERDKKIMFILETLGIEAHAETYVHHLSGGQRKRLSIAVELVDDPSIIFLDEPTTGLDSSSTTQCVQLLKNLAQEGKTIICTIHTPSALLLKKFDHLYALADGSCIYQGSTSNLVPFLTELDLVCPETFNPADFLLEIANNDYGMQNHRLIARIENGINSNYRQSSPTTFIKSKEKDSTINAISEFTPSFMNEVIQLTARNMLFNRRDKSYMMIRVFVYLIVGILVGVMYFRIGNEAKQIINIFKSIYIMVAFLMYTSLYSLTVRFPLDLPILRREYFNRHYSVAAHYFALNLADIPVIIICAVIFTTVSYVMTNHPLQDYRLGTILGIAIALSFTAQAYGIFAGSIVELKLSLLFAALLMVYQIIFAGGLVFMKDVSHHWHWMFEISFMKHALDGYGSLILKNRPKLNCDDKYCHFASAQKFLNLIGMEENIPKVFYSLAIIAIVFHSATYLIMRYRLR